SGRATARRFGLPDARVVFLGDFVRVFVDVPHAGITWILRIFGDAVRIAVMLYGQDLVDERTVRAVKTDAFLAPGPIMRFFRRSELTTFGRRSPPLHATAAASVPFTNKAAVLLETLEIASPV